MQTCAGAAHRVGNHLNRLVLSDDARLQPLFHFEQLLDLTLHHLGHGDPGPLRNHLRHIIGIHLFLEHLLVFLKIEQLLILVRQLFVELDENAVA